MQPLKVTFHLLRWVELVRHPYSNIHAVCLANKYYAFHRKVKVCRTPEFKSHTALFVTYPGSFLLQLLNVEYETRKFVTIFIYLSSLIYLQLVIKHNITWRYFFTFTTLPVNCKRMCLFDFKDSIILNLNEEKSARFISLLFSCLVLLVFSDDGQISAVPVQQSLPSLQ